MVNIRRGFLLCMMSQSSLDRFWGPPQKKKKEESPIKVVEKPTRHVSPVIVAEKPSNGSTSRPTSTRLATSRPSPVSRGKHRNSGFGEAWLERYPWLTFDIGKS